MLQKPKNCYALALRLLIENKIVGVTMKDAMRDHFHKFQSRLLEVEKSLSKDGNPRSLKLKIIRLPETRKNRFGHSMTYTRYRATCSINYLINLYNKINKQGLKEN